MTSIALLSTVFLGYSCSSQVVGFQERVEAYIYTRRVSVLFETRHLIAHTLSYSWDAMRHTANVPDAELNMRFRNTALFIALQATMRARHRAEGYISRPSEALEIPDHSEIVLRWPGMSPDEADAVERDYARESKELAYMDMENTFESVQQLLAEHSA